MRELKRPEACTRQRKRWLRGFVSTSDFYTRPLDTSVQRENRCTDARNFVTWPIYVVGHRHRQGVGIITGDKNVTGRNRKG